MRKWLRRIRGAIGMGLTWAAGWSPIGAIAGFLVATFVGAPVGLVTVNYLVLFAVLGFAGGAAFSTFLGLVEGRRRFEELSLPRFIALGALGGLSLGGLSAALQLLGAGFTLTGAIVAGITTALGAGSAAGTLALARRADHDLLEGAIHESGLEGARPDRRIGGSPG